MPFEVISIQVVGLSLDKPEGAVKCLTKICLQRRLSSLDEPKTLHGKFDSCIPFNFRSLWCCHWKGLITCHAKRCKKIIPWWLCNLHYTQLNIDSVSLSNTNCYSLTACTVTYEKWALLISAYCMCYFACSRFGVTAPPIHSEYGHWWVRCKLNSLAELFPAKQISNQSTSICGR